MFPLQRASSAKHSLFLSLTAREHHFKVYLWSAEGKDARVSQRVAPGGAARCNDGAQQEHPASRRARNGNGDLPQSRQGVAVRVGCADGRFQPPGVTPLLWDGAMVPAASHRTFLPSPFDPLHSLTWGSCAAMRGHSRASSLGIYFSRPGAV